MKKQSAPTRKLTHKQPKQWSDIRNQMVYKCRDGKNYLVDSISRSYKHGELVDRNRLTPEQRAKIGYEIMERRAVFFSKGKFLWILFEMVEPPPQSELTATEMAFIET